MKTTLITIGVYIGTIIAIAIYDVWVLIEPTPGDTISEIGLATGFRHPFAAFAAGVVFGHILWPLKGCGSFSWKRLVILGVISIALLTADLLGVIPLVVPFAWALPGMLAGHWLWPQPWERMIR